MLRRSLSFLLLGCFAFPLCSHAQAYSSSGKEITYTFQGTASGSFQPVSSTAATFTNAPFTITAIADPANVVAATEQCKVPSGVCKIWSVPVISARISVGGVTATFVTPLAIFDD